MECAKVRLDLEARRQIVETNYKAYQKAGKKERVEIEVRYANHDRLVPVTGMNRSYLATRLRTYKPEIQVTEGGKTVKVKAAKAKRGKKRASGGGRKPEYAGEFVACLARIWEFYDQMCGKLLAPTMRLNMEFLEEWPEFGINEQLRAKLVKISPAQIDRLLAPERKKQEIRGKSLTKPGNLLKSQIPVRTNYTWDERKPGFFEFDTVAHCGQNTAGQFCRTLTGTDVYSGWVEERSMLNNAKRWTLENIASVRGELPFPLLGIDTDNGGEFINDWLHDWCLTEQIAFTRSRPYRKNDNCFVEQKNGDKVRKTVGYFRFDTPQEQAALADVYKYLCPLSNYFLPTMKVIAKTKLDNGRYKKQNEKTPKTPYQRLLDSPDVSEDCKAELRRRKSLYNPVVLKKLMDMAIAHLLKINREKATLELPSGSQANA